MNTYKVDRAAFNFKYLPEFAKFILDKKFDEFVTVGIRFAREVNIPMLRPLANLPEEQLVEISKESNRLSLQAIIDGTIADHIEANIQRWVDNKLGIIERTQIVAEDLTLVYHIKRKLYSHFLYSYTKNTVVHQLIMDEVDVLTTQEQLVTIKAHVDIQNEHGEK